MSGVPFPRPWYYEVFIDDPNTAAIYDSDDYRVATVHSSDPHEDEGDTWGLYTADEVAAFIVERANR